jgi:epoxyqueuosine reductase QueG
VKSNRGQKEWPSKEWTLLRTFGDEVFIPKVAEYLISQLGELGYNAVAPRYCDWFKVYPAEGRFISSWSERHIAFAAGLGTFSLNDAMITEKGVSVKLLSVVADIKLQPDARTAKSHTENCLYLSKGICGACIKRCPVGAISKDGHDKMKCYAYVYGEASKQRAVSTGASEKAGSGCGLCQSGVPCEYKKPAI